VSRLLQIIQRVPLWSLIFTFCILRGVEQTVVALVLKRDPAWLIDAWCPVVVSCCCALGAIRYQEFPAWLQNLTGLGAAGYAVLSFLRWKTHLPTLQNSLAEGIILLVVAGFWSIALVYLTQAVLRLRRPSPLHPAGNALAEDRIG
jgi:hypothetical protein